MILVIGDEETIRGLLAFLYAVDYVLPEEIADSDEPFTDELLYHSNMHAAADFYLIPTLKQAAARNFDAALRIEDDCDTDGFLHAVGYIYDNPVFSGDQS